MKNRGFVLFLLVALSTWTLLNAYFLWRVETLPLFSSRASRWSLTLSVVFLALSYLVGRIFVHRGFGGFAAFLEIAGACWMGVLFIFFTWLLFADILTLFGYVKPATVYFRYGALVVASLLTLFSLFQGLRTPVVREEKIEVKDPKLAGLRIVQLSDLHLGVINGEGYLERIVERVNGLKPDLVVVTGDIIDTDGRDGRRFKEIFRGMKPPLGVYAVLGNHEYYHGAEKNPEFFEEAGMVLLRNRSVRAGEGLVLAGIDDLSARRQFRNGEDFLGAALKERPQGFLVLLSHSPLEVEKASQAGVDLMLSGHTHSGQIWPFSVFSKMAYPYNYGRYRVGDMTLSVTRGSGTWGPPMRLFKPSEIVLITFTN